MFAPRNIKGLLNMNNDPAYVIWVYKITLKALLNMIVRPAYVI
jgi:hypothetical protein